MQEANQKAEQVIASAKKEILTKIEQTQRYIRETERTTSEMRSIAMLDVQRAKDSIKLEDEQERLKRQIEGYKGIIQTANDIDCIGKKSSVGGKVTLTADEVQRLKDQWQSMFDFNICPAIGNSPRDYQYPLELIF